MRNRLKIALSFVLLGCLAALAYWIDGFDLFPEHNAVRIVQPKKSHGPDISYCLRPDHEDLWDCIRNGDYKNESMSGDYNERVRKHMRRTDI